MERYSPDIGYFVWSIIMLIHLILLMVSFWMLLKSKNLGSGTVLALLLASLFILVIGPLMSIKAMQKHHRRVGSQCRVNKAL